jgi:hypothetical protein
VLTFQPKGDLSVLLGSVPEYSPLETDDGFPTVPITDAHPYHIVVVAGQECPTESGVPRGLGGGVIRGMKLGQQNRKDKKADKDKEILKDDPDTAASTPTPGATDKPSHSTPVPTHLAPDDTATPTAESAESTEVSRAASPALGHTPTLHRHAHPPGVKGWSSMLDGELRSAGEVGMSG